MSPSRLSWAVTDGIVCSLIHVRMSVERLHLRILFKKRRSRISTALLTFSLSVLVAHWLAIFAFVIPRLGTLGFLRLHYTAAIGVDWIGSWWMVFSFPVFGLLVFFVNLSLENVLTRQHRSLAIVVHVSTALTEIALAFGGIAAVLLNR